MKKIIQNPIYVLCKLKIVKLIFYTIIIYINNYIRKKYCFYFFYYTKTSKTQLKTDKNLRKINICKFLNEYAFQNYSWKVIRSHIINITPKEQQLYFCMYFAEVVTFLNIFNWILKILMKKFILFTTCSKWIYYCYDDFLSFCNR